MRIYTRLPPGQYTHNLRVGSKVRIQRMNHGLTQRVAATLAGLSRARLSAIENGHTAASHPELHRLAAVLGTSVATFATPDT